MYNYTFLTLCNTVTIYILTLVVILMSKTLNRINLIPIKYDTGPPKTMSFSILFSFYRRYMAALT